MAISHAIASGMGGMRAAGDLVARMQMTRGMKIDEAKAYVADKLSISVSDLTDPVLMTDIRQDLEIGSINPLPGCAKGLEAKIRIAEVLDIESCLYCCAYYIYSVSSTLEANRLPAQELSRAFVCNQLHSYLLSCHAPLRLGKRSGLSSDNVLTSEMGVEACCSNLHVSYF